MDKIVKSFQYGAHTVTLETGEMARQASASVLVDMDGTTVLVTVVAKKEATPGKDFFPLTVNYQEKTYAAGKIPGGFLKREGRPSEFETLTCRLIDRPIRPLFPEGFKNEVQIVATVLSLNPEICPDIPALIGASAALTLSGAPFDGPIGAARVGYIDNQFILNPTQTQLIDSKLNLVVAGTEGAVLMVESEADILPEDVMLDSVWFGHEQMQTAIDAIHDLAAQAGVDKWDWQAEPKNESLATQLTEKFAADIESAYQITDKMSRYERLGEISKASVEAFVKEDQETPTSDEVKSTLADITKAIVRKRVLSGQPRIDGRDTRTVRPINIRTKLLAKTHGSALFTRGETQALVVATLGSSRDAQFIDSLQGESKDHFMLHYNFPPFCVGETGMMTGPKRREIGHGRLARRGMEAVLPSYEDFPYVLRVVSEILESNGSSSMASVCGTSLALMDAGVPLKAPVAGVAMGLVKEGDSFAVLTDILGDEDHLGDMDFKVTGTQEGITALQMDMKIQGINKFIMQQALKQAQEGRLHILGKMNEVISTSREEVSENAPRIIKIMVKPEKVRDVIGKGGSTIRALTEETGVTIDIEDDGTVNIFAVDASAAADAQKRIEDIVAEAEIGQIYEGPVSKILDFGAIVNVLPGKDGLVHISQISEERVENVTDHLSEGQVVRVRVIDIDRQGRIRLSMKPSVLEEEKASSEVSE